jgi:hypothetical protein
MTFEPIRHIGGKRYIYYNSYSSKRYAEIKGNVVMKQKGNPNSKLIIRKGYEKSKPYAVFIHWGHKE